MDKYQNKYRIKSHRRSGWNYADEALYFITICCKDRVCFFGNIRNQKMHYSEMGKIAQAEWIKTYDIRPDMNLYMGEYVVMPNHFHAIIGIGKNEYNTSPCDDVRRDDVGRDVVKTHCNASLPHPNHPPHDPTPPYKNQFGPQSKNLASIVRGYKTAVTKNSRIIHPDFAWQTNYHDSIIRDKNAFQNITKYIANNIKNWDEDRFYKQPSQ